jgi:hypothetical protein
MIGQSLYLGAEAAGMRATGIGCYFDQVMHDALGLRDRTWQSLVWLRQWCVTEGGPCR